MENNSDPLYYTPMGLYYVEFERLYSGIVDHYL